MGSAKTPCVLTFGVAATTDSTEQVIPISKDGEPALPAIPVPPGTTLVLSDIDVSSGGGIGIFKFQQDNGSGFFTILRLELTGVGLATWLKVNPRVAWMINGNDGTVSFRVLVTTPAGALPVACVMNGYCE